MIDAERQQALNEASTKELVDELRKREGVDAYDVSVDSDSRIILYGHGTEFVDTGTEKGAAIILRITEQATRYINETVAFGKIQAEILLDFMDANKKAIDKHQNRVALLIFRDNLRTFLEKDVGWDGTKDSETGGMRNKFGFEICPKCHRELPEDKNGNLGHCLYCTNPFELERPRQ